jgi:hypothetical protein
LLTQISTNQLLNRLILLHLRCCSLAGQGDDEATWQSYESLKLTALDNCTSDQLSVFRKKRWNNVGESCTSSSRYSSTVELPARYFILLLLTLHTLPLAAWELTALPDTIILLHHFLLFTSLRLSSLPPFFPQDSVRASTTLLVLTLGWSLLDKAQAVQAAIDFMNSYQSVNASVRSIITMSS